MKTLKHILVFISILILMMSLYKCASTPELQKVIPSEFENAYFQKWNAGIKEGGSGINVFIKLNDKSIQLDSIYFRDRVSKLNISSENEGLCW